LDKKELIKTVEKAIKEYNRYRSPEAIARLIDNDFNFLEIEFTGSFCNTCGFYDYFEDYIVTLEEYGLKIKTAEIQEIGEGAIVKFYIS
jgi:superoxide reductase